MTMRSETDILLVEDEMNILLSLKYILESKNYLVETAQNGKEAVQKIKDHSLKILILDLVLPDMTGFEILESVKELRNFPVIMLTARNRPEDQEKALKLQVDEYLVKPYNPDNLLLIIEKMMKSRRKDV
ncbi:MAG TPA: hypothetical protein DHW82_00045 [Spirochaetia bacterium]|nr:MAG: hypothetical protein A2Y41_09890 [Spirochaetes bacterium GWB1_36_13]HCL55392.1 hypothetical protein [Spirochaetia bacterium]